MPRKKKSDRAQAISAWRKQYWLEIMEKNRAVLEGIRDKETAKDKDRVDAAKTLGRMVDGLSPEKIIHGKPTGEQPNIEKVVLTAEEKELISRILDEPKHTSPS